jgi:hypothetical protein
MHGFSEHGMRVALDSECRRLRNSVYRSHEGVRRFEVTTPIG